MKNVFKKLRSDLIVMRKSKNVEMVKFLSFLLGEIDRAGKDHSDEAVRAVLVKVRTQLSKAPNPNVAEIELIGNYLPSNLTLEELNQFLLTNTHKLVGMSFPEVIALVKDYAAFLDKLIDGRVVMPAIKKFIGK